MVSVSSCLRTSISSLAITKQLFMLNNEIVGRAFWVIQYCLSKNSLHIYIVKLLGHTVCYYYMIMGYFLSDSITGYKNYIFFVFFYSIQLWILYYLGCCIHMWYTYTVCPRSLDPFYIVTYYVKWDETSWTYSMWIVGYLLGWR